MEQMSREELIALIQQLEGQYYVLNDRVRDIRDKQTEFLTQQAKARNLIYRIDREAGYATCQDCLIRLPLDSEACPQCGEEL